MALYFYEVLKHAGVLDYGGKSAGIFVLCIRQG